MRPKRENQFMGRTGGDGFVADRKGGVMASQEELERYRQRLLQLRTRLRNEIEGIGQGARDVVNRPGEDPDVMTHMADQDTELLDQEAVVGRTLNEVLNDVRAALERVDEGSYGRCERCGGAISGERLMAIPYARFCIRCERKEERGQ